MKLLKHIILGIFLLSVIHTFAREHKKILVLHSYHQGLQWTDNVNKGIGLVIDSLGNDIEIDYEYLDTKRNPSTEYLNKIIELYNLKLHSIKYDVIIVSDNNALSFIKDHREKYFKNTPIVFCGINHFTNDLIDGLNNITGITETVDLKGIVNLVLSTRPKDQKYCCY